MLHEADYVIVGAGTAGCVLANRLTDDPRTRVVLVEAGGANRHPLSRIPAGFLRLLDHPKLSWQLRTEPEAATGDRAILFPRGKGLGGSSAINGLLYVRPLAGDLDHWAQLGNRGWSFADTLAYFRRSESWEGGGDEWRGGEGPLRIARLLDPPELCEAIIAAGVAQGLAYRDDANAPSDASTIFLYQQTRKGRLRASAATAFLQPALRRPNLRVLAQSHVRRVLLEGHRAVGVEIERGGRTETVRAARETVLAGGVIGSPHVLQLSGIGDPDDLAPLGIPVAHALPGVGKNFQDHYVVRLTYRIKDIATINERVRGLGMLRELAAFALRGRGVLTYSAALVGAYVQTSLRSSGPDVQYVIAPASFRAGVLGALEAEGGLSCGCWQMRPLSRGSVTARSADPRVPPRIRPGFLKEQADCDAVVAGLRFGRKLVHSDPLGRYVAAETLPGKEAESDAALLDYARRNGSTVYHAVGTCRMGDDAGAVVDSELRVRGLDALRVIDGSIMPAITSTNTNATVLMIAEKGADLLRA
ncbi:MAG TPA: GMC family oxidoreductase N-terminal domain-containing protein [Xanthobacteraceae bacterium]